MCLCFTCVSYTDVVKLLCETKLGVVSQVVLAKHATTAKPQYLANVLLKINAKVTPPTRPTHPTYLPTLYLPTSLPQMHRSTIYHIPHTT